MDPYRKIMRAAKQGRDVRLSADDVSIMALDEMIASRALVAADELCKRTNHRKGRKGVCACQSI